MIDAGQLNKRVTIERIASTTKGPTGQDLHQWEPIATVWAKIKTINGTETKQANQIKAMTDYEIMIYDTDLSVLDRLVYGSIRLQITHINRDDDFFTVINATGKAG